MNINENTVFSNETGQVMFGAGGNIYKMPYEIGLVYSNALTANHYINITGLTLENEYSYVCYCNIFSNGPTLGLIQSSSNRVESVDLRPFAHYATDFYGIIITGSNSVPQGIRYQSHRDNISSIWRSSTLDIHSLNRGETNLYPGVRDRFLIGASGNPGNPVFSSPVKASSGNRIYRVIIFNRELTLEELRWMHNNQSMNPPITLQGAAHDYVMNNRNFEILELDGVDKVCVRDRIGGRHGEVMNLPAGTLQEQLSYANNNLFLPFYTL